MNLGRVLSWTAERFPERVGLAGARRLTYRQWDARTNQVARVLLGAGVGRGSRVAMLLSNSEVLASTHLACQKVGAMATPLNVRLGRAELEYCLGDATPTVVVTDDATGELASRVLSAAETASAVFHAGMEGPQGTRSFEQAVAVEPDAAVGVEVGDDDASVMLYTSGTTGRPKGVPRTQRNELAASVAHVLQTGTRSGEVTLGAMPMYHTMGLRSLLSTVVVGGTFVEQPRFTAAQGVELVAAEGVTSLYLVPTAFWALDDTGDLGAAAARVTRLAYAGAPMTSTLTNRLDETVRPEVFVNHYGSSEVYTFSVEERAGEKPGSAGRPGMFSRLRLASVDDGSPVAPGVTGEVLASLASDEAFSGYWHRPDADARSLRDGWYHTGDLGVVDENGDLWVVGRVDDMIVTGGENVHPVEVEDVLTRSPEVAECAVVGLPDERWGQAVTAFVVFRDADADAAAADRLARWVREGSDLADYKRPKHVVAVDEIPKSPVGKILRRKLQERSPGGLNC